MSVLQLACAEFQGNMSAGLQSMLESEEYANVTIAVEGKHLKAHQMVLSICSPYFHSLLQSTPSKHPIIFMKNVKYTVMKHLLRFMYEGQTQIEEENFTSFIETAKELQVKWLTKCYEQHPAAPETTSTALKRSVRSTTPEPSTPVPAPIVDESPSCAKRARADERNTDCEVTASGSNDTPLAGIGIIKREKANDAYQEQMMETMGRMEHQHVSATSTDAGNQRFFVEPMDKTRDLAEMVMSFLGGNDHDKVKEERIEEHRDVVDIDDDDDDEDELMQPMDQQMPHTSLQPPGTHEGQPVTISYYEVRNTVNIMINNYSYHKDRVSKSWISWRCTRQCSRSCKATVQLTSDKRIIFKNEHTHMPESKLDAKKIINEEIYFRQSVLLHEREVKFAIQRRRCT